MSNNDLLDVLDLVTSGLDSGAQFVLGFVSNAAEDVGNDRSPDFWVVFPTARFPEDEAFVRMVNQNAIPMWKREISALV